MRYPPPKKAHHWRKNLKDQTDLPHTIVRKRVHGQMVDVKVYKPAWARGDIQERSDLGLKNDYNRFSRDRAQTLQRKKRERDAEGKWT